MIQELVTRRYRRNLPSELQNVGGNADTNAAKTRQIKVYKGNSDQSASKFGSGEAMVGKIETKMSRPLACFAPARPQNDRSLVLIGPRARPVWNIAKKLRAYFLLFESRQSSESKLFSQKHDAISKPSCFLLGTAWWHGIAAGGAGTAVPRYTVLRAPLSTLHVAR